MVRKVRKARRKDHVAAMLGVLCVSACPSPEVLGEPPFVPQYSTERLRVRLEFDAAICSGQMGLWEDQIDAVEQSLGVTRDYVWIALLNNSTALAEKCQAMLDLGDVAGCWDGLAIYSQSNKVAHEIVHAWTMSSNTDPLPILREGLAVRMEGPVLRPDGPAYTAQSLLKDNLAIYEYEKAGHLVAWLMATYGAERFMDLYSRVSRTGTEGELRSGVRSALGDELEEVLNAYEKAPDTYYPAMGSQACGEGERIPWQGDAARWSAFGSCLNGPWLGYERSTWQRVSVEVPVGGEYVLDTGGRAGAMSLCLEVPTKKQDVVMLDFPVTNDWENREPLGSLFWAYGRRVDEDWRDLSLALEAGVYEIWIDRSFDDQFADEGMSLTKI